MQETNNSKSFQWVLAGALVLIALFVVIMLVNVKSQAIDDTDLATTVVDVTPVAPSVSDIKVVTTSGGSSEYSTGASGVLPGLTTVVIYVQATITDNNGIGDVSTNPTNILASGNISAFEMQVYHNSTANRGNSTNCLNATATAGGSSAADDQNNCYSNGSINTTGTTQGVCTLLSRNSTISMTVQCPFTIAAVANATDASSDVSSEVWKAGVLVTDDDGLMNGTQAAPSFSSDFDIRTTGGIGFSGTWSSQDTGTIDYGDALVLGTQSSSVPLAIYNYGNDKSTVTVAATPISTPTGWPALSGDNVYAMDCTVGYIDADDQVYKDATITTWGTGTTALTGSAVSVGSGVTLPYRNVTAQIDLSAEANTASDTMYWMLKTSSTAGISGTCTGTNSIASYPL